MKFLVSFPAWIALASSLLAQAPEIGLDAKGEERIEGALRYVDGSLHPDDDAIHGVNDLRKVQLLRIQVDRQSGNLDPFVGIPEPTKAPVEVVEAFRRHSRTKWISTKSSRSLL